MRSVLLGECSQRGRTAGEWDVPTAEVLSPKSCHSAIWFIEQLLVLSRTAQADNYYLPGQAGASAKPPGLSASLFLSFQLIPSAFSQKKIVKIISPKEDEAFFVIEINILCYHFHTFACSRCCVWCCFLLKKRQGGRFGEVFMDSQALSPPNSRGKLICGAAQREFTPVKKLPHQIKRQRAEHEVPALLSCTSSHSDITTMPEHCIMPRLSPPPKKTHFNMFNNIL